MLVPYVGIFLRVCMSFREKREKRGGGGGGRKIGDGMGDDRLDLITGWNGWEGLWCAAFSIVHSCVQAGAGSTARDRPLPEGLGSRDAVRTGSGPGVTANRPDPSGRGTEDESAALPVSACVTLEGGVTGPPRYMNQDEVFLSSQVLGWN